MLKGNSISAAKHRLKSVIEQDRASVAVEELDALRLALLGTAKAYVTFDESEASLGIEHHEGKKVLKLTLPITGIVCEGETTGV